MYGKTLTIRIGGEVGSGVHDAADVLVDLLIGAQHSALGFAGQDGEVEFAQIRCGDRPILSVGDSLDVLMAWSQSAYDRFRSMLWPEGLLLYDPEKVRPDESDAPIRHAIALSKIAAKTGGPRSCVAAGVIARLCGLSSGPQVPAEGVAAFDEGFALARRPPLGVVYFELERWVGPKRRSMSGGRALAEGLVAAGAKVAVCRGQEEGSPIRSELEKAGIDVIDAADGDDALATMRARSPEPMVVVEGRGLEGLTEAFAATIRTPLLLVRSPTPSYHGDRGSLEALQQRGRSRLVFSPATIEECALHAHHGFSLCVAHRAPVAIYVDPLLLGHQVSMVSPTYPSLARVPEALPSAARILSRRWSEVHFPAGARIGLLSWGAMQGAIREARLEGELRGIRLAHFHPRVISPLPSEGLQRFCESLVRLVVVEPAVEAGPLGAIVERHFEIAVERLAWPAGVPLTPAGVLGAADRADSLGA